MPHLSFFEGERPLFVHLLRPGRTVIGRSDRCDVSLPSEQISRVHCFVEHRTDGWWLTDRSRNGTLVNGAAAQRHALTEGDRITLGSYTAEFAPSATGHAPDHTTRAIRPAWHEELVEVGDGQVATTLARLRFTRGPRAGHTVLLQTPHISLGGSESDIVLGGDLPPVVARLRVVRSRMMIEPAQGAVLLAGSRVRDLTPVYVGEEVRVGEHAFVFELHTHAEHEENASFGALVGRSPTMLRLFGVLARMAAHDAPALLVGESGTGKELAARGLHDSSLPDGPFVALNCAALADKLVESELFGHEKGAFTGATQRQDGAFQRAHGGTLFLDEIGELPLEQQAKLLRALESGEVRRVGGAAPEFPDVRIVAATNRDLRRAVAEGTFRSDLYFRLAVLTVRMPPLRDHPRDIELIARELLRRHHPDATITTAAVAALENYAWPGNVRELRNVLTRAYVLHGERITAGSLVFHPWAFDGEAPPAPSLDDDPERARLREALDAAGGNRSQAARALGIPRSSLLYKMKRFDLR